MLCWYPDDAFDDIINVGEIAAMVAVVKQLNGFPLSNRLRKLLQCHVGTVPRAIDGKETQTGRGQAIEMGVGMRHQLIGVLGRRVET